MRITTDRPDVVDGNRMDFGAACEQSGNIAAKEGFPITRDRMHDFAQQIRDGAHLVILTGTVTLHPNDTETLIVDTWDGQGETRHKVQYVITRVNLPVGYEGPGWCDYCQIVHEES